MTDNLRTLIAKLAALEDAARTVPVAAPGDSSAALNPDLQDVIDQERIVVEQIRQLRATSLATGDL